VLLVEMTLLQDVKAGLDANAVARAPCGLIRKKTGSETPQ
jgi:hypothetical protein